MNDLLQRMIQRTRTRLPAIEPLPVSRYAPVVPGINATAIGADSLETEELVDSRASSFRGIQTRDRIIDRTQFHSAISHRPPAPETLNPLAEERGTRPLQHPQVDATMRPAEPSRRPVIQKAHAVFCRAKQTPQEISPTHPNVSSKQSPFRRPSRSIQLCLTLARADRKYIPFPTRSRPSQRPPRLGFNFRNRSNARPK